MNDLTNIPADILNSNGLTDHVITDGCYNMNRVVHIRGIDTKITIQYSPFEIIFYNKDERTGKLFVNDDGCLSAEGNIEKSALDFFQIMFEETILRNL